MVKSNRLVRTKKGETSKKSKEVKDCFTRFNREGEWLSGRQGEAAFMQRNRVSGKAKNPKQTVGL